MKKITLLVCGSTGFIMSNFCRWILYRSKEFEIIGIDTVEEKKDFDTLYIHKDYRFYVGNVSDLNFLKKIVELHHPDIIINSINSENMNNKIKIIEATHNLLSLNIPIIQLSNAPSADPFGLWNCINKIVLKNKNTILEFPNCFGRRQKPHSSLAKTIKSAREQDGVNISIEDLPWVFVEDVASIIWYIIEKGLKGFIKMPALGYVNMTEIIEIINYKIGKLSVVNKTTDLMWPEICSFYSTNLKLGDWEPENTDIKGLIANTVEWYLANQWALLSI